MASIYRGPPAALNAEQSHTTKGLLRLTMACNERCPFCNVPQEDYPKPTPPFEEVCAELDGFITRGDKTVTISGGEPTLLRERLLTLIGRARAGGIAFVEVQTNAVLIDPGYASDLKAAGLTSAFVSLLSHTPSLHDKLAGLEGAFQRCLTGIDALLDQGIRVALNPVTARLTQDLVVDYVRFVGQRLPRVRSISMSAVQPHGRAASQLNLMPDYSRLGPQIKAARALALATDISLINPYCGLPLCVGWEDGLDVSVEAIEAAAPSPDTPILGIDNRGNKRHGEPCVDCALRPRCGGAWHGYWDEHLGRGLHAPLTVSPPWASQAKGQTVVEAWGGPTSASFDAIRHATTPARWLWTDTLNATDMAKLRASHLSHLALRCRLHLPQQAKPSLAIARRLVRSNSLVPSQARIQLHLEWPTPQAALTAQQIADGISWATAVGATSLTLCGPQAHQYTDRLKNTKCSVRLGVFGP